MDMTTRRLRISLTALVTVVAFGITFWMAMQYGSGAQAQREPVELFLSGYGYFPSLERATQDAQYVVEGKVTVAGPAQWSNIDGSSDDLVGRDRWGAVSRIVTPYRIEVAETLKGEVRDSIIVWQLGGSVDGDSLAVDPSMDPIAEGEEGIFYVYDKSVESHLVGVGSPGDGTVAKALVTNTQREESPSRATQADLEEARVLASEISSVGGES